MKRVLIVLQIILCASVCCFFVFFAVNTEDAIYCSLTNLASTNITTSLKENNFKDIKNSEKNKNLLKNNEKIEKNNEKIINNYKNSLKNDENIKNYKNDIEFYYSGRIFTYNYLKNIKKSNIFTFNYEINKYNRFKGYDERKNLLIKMLNAGFDEDVALNYLFPNLDKLILKIEKNVYLAPKDALLKIDSNSEKVFNITKEIVGQKLNKPLLYKNIISAFLACKKLQFNLPLIKLEPQVKAQEYEKFSYLRADFSTNISSSSADRKHNIKNALNALNKVEIMPSFTFSFNKTVGRRSEANGYRPAKIIVNNEFVEGVGGGVCQVSSTLYNSALLAGLKIEEANKHSKQVSYVKYGFDAMVNFGSSDLKIKNNTSEKITIITNYSANNIRIRIFGAKMQETYKLTNEIVSVTEPTERVEYDKTGEYADKVIYEDEFFYLKKPIKGMEIKSYREKYVNGTMVGKEQLRHDRFSAQEGVKVYGIKKRKENIFAPMVFDSLAKILSL